LLDGTRTYLHALDVNFSRRILTWRVAETFAPGTSVAALLDASRAATLSDTAPVVLADVAFENVNAQGIKLAGAAGQENQTVRSLEHAAKTMSRVNQTCR
jgi:hypothetical protein